MVAMKEAKRKGPWTQQEDLQLVCYVSLLGDRRWDSIAKISGLNRTGKSCRLRWLNYLHPGLKHGRMTPAEEHLILELHSKWGNKWSHIAAALPGRTDNEIKNYWRTQQRKMAKQGKMAMPEEKAEEVKLKVCPMDQLWSEIVAAADSTASGSSLKQWECCVESLWKEDDDEPNIMHSVSDHQLLVSNGIVLESKEN